MLFGYEWHPGGLELTRVLGVEMGIRQEDYVVDLACGMGSSAMFLADTFKCTVIGVDISKRNAREATARISKCRELTSFIVGDCRNLPLANSSMDRALIECALSTFNEKEAALEEVSRTLKSGGVLGLTDVSIEGELPMELKSLTLQPLCLSGALSSAEYKHLLSESGLDVQSSEERKMETVEFLEEIRKKLFLAKMLSGIGKLPVRQETIDYAKRLLSMARTGVVEGKLGYAMFVARKRD